MSTEPSHIQMPPSYRLAAFECLDSTNTELIRRLKDDPHLPQNLVVLAKTQTLGRGRRDRTWVSEEGNLFFSLLKRPERPVFQWAHASFVVALGLHGAIREILKQSDLSINCKWPNDLLIEGQKIAGILLETHHIQSQDKAALIIGVGVNVQSHPDPVLYPATSLSKVSEKNLNPHSVLEIILIHIDLWFQKWQTDGFGVVRDAWLKRAKGIGQEITVQLENEKISGRFAGLDEQGNLILESPVGTRQISAGDIFFKD